jgi:hypothetical protein
MKEKTRSKQEKHLLITVKESKIADLKRVISWINTPNWMKDDLARQVFTLETEIETLKKELE